MLANVEDNTTFQNIVPVSLSNLDRVLKRHAVTTKQPYNIPFELNSDGVKE